MNLAVVDANPALVKDLKVLALMIDLFCRIRHGEAERKPAALRTHDVAAIAGKTVVLCPECSKLLAHAFIKRTRCPMDPKPMCKHCPNHCYHPTYRAQIREVMRVAGKHMVTHGRLDYLFHLLF